MNTWHKARGASKINFNKRAGAIIIGVRANINTRAKRQMADPRAFDISTSCDIAMRHNDLMGDIRHPPKASRWHPASIAIGTKHHMGKSIFTFIDRYGFAKQGLSIKAGGGMRRTFNRRLWRDN